MELSDLIHPDFMQPLPLVVDGKLIPEMEKNCGFVLEQETEFSVKYTHKTRHEFGFDWNKTFGWSFRYYKTPLYHIDSMHKLQNVFYDLTNGQEIYEII